MKKILLLSDTHRFIDDVICRHAKEADEIWHAGDIGSLDVTDRLSSIRPVRAVYGNIDGDKIRSMFNETEIFMCENIKVYITHIGGYPGAYAKGIKEELQLNCPHLFVCGHSHILKVMRDKNLNNMLHLNPGAIGNHGFHQVRTMLKFEINKTGISNLNVIELKK